MNAEEVKAMLCIDHIIWNALACLLEKHPEESLHAPSSPRWTSRDVYAHLARWLEHSNACMEAYCADGELPTLKASPEEMNTRWQQEDRRMGLDDARKKARDAFRSRMHIIEAIPPDKWDDNLKSMIRYDGAWHYAKHINYIVVT